MEDNTSNSLCGQERPHKDKGNDLLFSNNAHDRRDSSSGFSGEQNDPWKILVVDDEEDIHTVTKMALKGFIFKDRGIEFLHTYSAKESEQVLREHPDIAVILLDV